MPARLSQVSALLAGSSLEEELLLLDTPSSPSGSSFQQNTKANPNGAGPSGSQARHPTGSSTHTTSLPSSYFSSSSVVVLSSDQSLLKRAVFPNAPSSSSNGQSSDIRIKAEAKRAFFLPHPNDPQHRRWSSRARLSYPPSPSNDNSSSRHLTSSNAMTHSTCPRPAASVLRLQRIRPMPPTSVGIANRSCGEASEKSRVDRLTRDRQKLLARIDQIKTAEARMLQPIVIARDQARAEAEGRTMTRRRKLGL